MLLNFKLYSSLAVDVCVRLVEIVHASVLYVMCGISTGYDIIVTGFFAGGQHAPVLERWTLIHTWKQKY